MIVVADTSAISNLAALGKEQLLFELFGNVFIPPAVEKEFLRWHSGIPGFLVSKEPHDAELIEDLGADLDAGEAEAIALAVEIRADILLIDERKGRARAASLGLRSTGLLGVLLQAKTMGLLENVRPVLDDLIAEAGFYISEDLRREFLRLAGE